MSNSEVRSNCNDDKKPTFMFIGKADNINLAIISIISSVLDIKFIRKQ